MAIINLDKDEFSEIIVLAIQVHSDPIDQIFDWMVEEYEKEGEYALEILSLVLDVVVDREGGLVLFAQKLLTSEKFVEMIDAINNYDDRLVN